MKENYEYIIFLAEAVTKEDNEKVLDLISRYSEYDCVVLEGTNIARGGLLLL